MATYSKIPWKARQIGAICSGPYAVFGDLLRVGPAFIALAKQDEKKGIPACGYITVKGKKYYYCRYGMVGDPDIYAKQPKSKKSTK